MSEIPEEIRAIRERLAQLETMAQGNPDFNSAVRRLARRTEVSGEDFNSAIRAPRNRITIEPEETDR